jgi:hypothetical protein
MDFIIQLPERMPRTSKRYYPPTYKQVDGVQAFFDNIHKQSLIIAGAKNQV